MAVELARANVKPKPWGILDVRPWSTALHDDRAVGEIWYERHVKTPSEPSLLLKLLFTKQPLSIQVHPNDTFARAMGLPNGKTEAWYILSATPDAKVAIGLQRRLTSQQLRAAIDDGSISDLLAWRPVSPDDIIFIPAGTIHAISAGLVIAEIQQRSDATFRMFDFGRNRELHVDNAVAAADAGPINSSVQKRRLTEERTLLVCNSHFVFERIELAPNSAWCMDAERETWLLVLNGGASIGGTNIGSFDAATGDAIFAQSDRVEIRAGPVGMLGVVAYTGGNPVPRLLRPGDPAGEISATRRQNIQVPT
jgi:mannose-6-phosphate isomerase